MEVFTFLFDSSNLECIMAYGRKCFEKGNAIGQVTKV